MNSTWNKKWKTLLLWMSSYLSIVAYALVGGYVIVKNEDEDLKKTAKIALVITMIFSGLSALLSLYSQIASFSNNYYSSAAYDFYSVCSSLVSIAKIVVYAVFVIMELVKKEDASTGEKNSDNV